MLKDVNQTLDFLQKKMLTKSVELVQETSEVKVNLLAFLVFRRSSREDIFNTFGFQVYQDAVLEENQISNRRN